MSEFECGEVSAEQPWPPGAWSRETAHLLYSTESPQSTARDESCPLSRVDGVWLESMFCLLTGTIRRGPGLCLVWLAAMCALYNQ